MSQNENYINHNGELVPAQRTVFSIENRAFQYGDGLFESIRVSNGKPLLLDLHLQRLKAGMSLLSLGPLDVFKEKIIEGEIEDILEKNGIEGGGRVKIYVYRKPGGFYAPQTNKFEYVISAQELHTNQYVLNSTGLKLGSYEALHKDFSPFSGIKSMSALLYVLAGVYLKSQKFDEVLLWNSRGNISECCASNIFLISNGKLITPPLSDACLDGVMRKFIIENTSRMKLVAEEKSISKTDVLAADEVFLTNAIHGIQWVVGFENKRYKNTLSKKIISDLNSLVWRR